MKFESIEQVEKFGEQNNKVLVINGDEVLDVTTFAKHHPGGASLIHRYQNKDLSQEMKTHHILTYKLADSMAIGSFTKDLKKFVDPQKPLMPQVWNMKHQDYLQLVNSPHWLFADSPRMFQSDLFEFFSHNKWQSVIILQGIILFWLVNMVNWSMYTSMDVMLLISVGIFIFSLVEYIFHRFIFHSEKHLLDNKIVRYLHFIIHGIHHMLPVDPDRLVLPPTIAVIYVYCSFNLFLPIFQTFVLFDTYVILYIGVIVGYTTYDCTHYALHHIGKQTGYFGDLQRYHNQHHFGGEDAGYGVTSKFWDIVFGTTMSKDLKHKTKGKTSAK